MIVALCEIKPSSIPQLLKQPLSFLYAEIRESSLWLIIPKGCGGLTAVVEDCSVDGFVNLLPFFRELSLAHG